MINNNNQIFFEYLNERNISEQNLQDLKDYIENLLFCIEKYQNDESSVNKFYDDLDNIIQIAFKNKHIDIIQHICDKTHNLGNEINQCIVKKMISSCTDEEYLELFIKNYGFNKDGVLNHLYIFTQLSNAKNVIQIIIKNFNIIKEDILLENSNTLTRVRVQSLFNSNLELIEYLCNEFEFTKSEYIYILPYILSKLAQEYVAAKKYKKLDQNSNHTKDIFNFLLNKSNYKLKLCLTIELFLNLDTNIFEQAQFLIENYNFSIYDFNIFLIKMRREFDQHNEIIAYISKYYLEFYGERLIESLAKYKNCSADFILKIIKSFQREGFDFNAEYGDIKFNKFNNYLHYLIYKVTEKYTYGQVCNKCPEHILSLLQQVIKITKEVDFNINNQNHDFSPLFWAAYKGYKDLAIALIEKGADLKKEYNVKHDEHTYSSLEIILQSDNYNVEEKYKLQKYANYYEKVHGSSQSASEGQEAGNEVRSNVGKDAKTTIFKYLTEKKSQKTADFGIIHKMQRSAWSFVKNNLIFNWFKSIATWVKPNNLFGKAKCKEHFTDKEAFFVNAKAGNITIENAEKYPYFAQKYAQRTMVQPAQIQPKM